MVNIVVWSGIKYLVDVGSGSRCFGPIPLENGLTFQTMCRSSCILTDLLHTAVPFNMTRTWSVSLLPSEPGGILRELYSFHEAAFFPEDFKMMYIFERTVPGFRSNECIYAERAQWGQRSEISGWLRLHNDIVSYLDLSDVLGFGTLTVMERLYTEGDRVRALRKYFGIKLSSSERMAMVGKPEELKGAQPSVATRRRSI